MDTPIRFRLVLNGDDCILIDGRDESRYVLPNTGCVAAGAGDVREHP